MLDLNLHKDLLNRGSCKEDSNLGEVVEKVLTPVNAAEQKPLSGNKFSNRRNERSSKKLSSP